eukprot:365217-Chlamydomonas_euryale.AAC.3
MLVVVILKAGQRAMLRSAHRTPDLLLYRTASSVPHCIINTALHHQHRTASSVLHCIISTAMHLTTALHHQYRTASSVPHCIVSTALHRQYRTASSVPHCIITDDDSSVPHCITRAALHHQYPSPLASQPRPSPLLAPPFLLALDPTPSPTKPGERRRDAGRVHRLFHAAQQRLPGPSQRRLCAVAGLDSGSPTQPVADAHCSAAAHGERCPLPSALKVASRRVNKAPASTPPRHRDYLVCRRNEWCRPKFAMRLDDGCSLGRDAPTMDMQRMRRRDVN